MEALGRLLNISRDNDAAAWIHAGLGNNVLFCIGAAGAAVLTVQEATTAAGAGAANLAVIERYYTNTAADGSGPWTLVEQAAAATATAPAGGMAVVEISVTKLSDGNAYIQGNADAGEVVCIITDLNQRRDASELVAMAT